MPSKIVERPGGVDAKDDPGQVFGVAVGFGILVVDVMALLKVRRLWGL